MQVMKMATEVFYRAVETLLMTTSQQFVAREAWDGSSLGPEYLQFDKGAKLRLVPAPRDVDPIGWSYGRVDLGRPGWFPPACAKPLQVYSYWWNSICCTPPPTLSCSSGIQVPGENV